MSTDPLADAIVAHRAGQLGVALRCYARAVKRPSAGPEAHRLYGVALLQARRAAAAVEQLERAVALAPDDAAAHSNLAVALRRTLRLGDAHQHALRAAELDPGDATAQFNLGNAAAGIGACEAAAQAYHRSLALRSDHLGALIGLGHMYRALGARSDALDAYRACVALKPEWGEAWWSIANVKTEPMSDHDLASIDALLDRSGGVTDVDRAALHYARGKALEDRALYDAAFAAFSAGASIMRPRGGFSSVASSAVTDALIECVTPGFIDARRDWGCRDEAPIFIVGLPRSGSTLLERILASHPEIEAPGELPYLPELAVGPSDAGPAATLEGLDAEGCAALGRRYLDLAAAHRRGAPRFIDKMPNNFWHIALIRLTLPRAVIIDARRHPLDSCVGSFKQYFAEGQRFSYGLEDLAAYYRDYHRLMRHWQEIGLHYDSFDYEAVVGRFEDQTRRLFAACSLSPPGDVADFHKRRGPVLSASAEQVREPLHARSVDAWHRYERHLEPLIEGGLPIASS